MDKPFSYTVVDPKLNWASPISVDSLPEPKEGFVWWRGELREVREIHVTANGKQMELF
jgi:hypothetical protein